MKRLRLVSLVLAVASLAMALAWAAAPPPAQAAAVQFRVTFAGTVQATPATGRLLVIVAPKADPEPRLQADDGGVTDTPPFWGVDVTDVAPGQVMTLGTGTDTYGYPFASFDQLPAGDYYVQALLNVYTVFHRSDGSVVALHLPQGEGQDPFVSPGNLVSTPVLLHIDPATGGTFDLQLDKVLPPTEPVPAGGTAQQGNPPDSAHVKHIKIQSQVLTQFWGQPMYIAANVLLPRGYSAKANRHVRYPVVWHQTHFPSSNPFGFKENGSDDFSKWWVSKNAPRVIGVEIRHENPYFDDSYAVDSANLGPYGTAITKELMPAVEKQFRIVRSRWARTVTGGSTGGWETAAQMIFYPKLYSGAWVFYPDPLDFHYHQVIDVYNDVNAYFRVHDFLNVPRPAAREISGDTQWTVEEENHWELALGTRGRSGLGQWDVWQAVYGPQGPDGYPAPIWNKVTGVIDHAVAQQWLPKDLDHYVTTNWGMLGNRLSGRMHFFVGTADTFFLDNAVRLFQHTTKKLTDPKTRFTYRYGLYKPHGWSPYTTQQLITIMARYMARQAPSSVNTSAWLHGK